MYFRGKQDNLTPIEVARSSAELVTEQMKVLQATVGNLEVLSYPHACGLSSDLELHSAGPA